MQSLQYTYPCLLNHFFRHRPGRDKDLCQAQHGGMVVINKRHKSSLIAATKQLDEVHVISRRHYTRETRCIIILPDFSDIRYTPRGKCSFVHQLLSCSTSEYSIVLWSLM